MKTIKRVIFVLFIFSILGYIPFSRLFELNNLGKYQVFSSIKRYSEQILKDIARNFKDKKNVASSVSLVSRREDQVVVASFNIQVFGQKKIRKKRVMDILNNIIKNFDITAIQEIRDASKKTLPFFLSQLNSNGKYYRAVASPRLGRTSSKERYAFIFNKKKVSFNGRAYIFPDTYDYFERDPFIAEFSSGKFDFTLINVHIKPSDARNEISNIQNVINYAQSMNQEDRDIIVLGDYNSDGTYFSESITKGLRSSIYNWAVRDSFDTTLASGNNTYDRIVFRRKYTDEDFTGQCSVFRFDNFYNISPMLAKEVSDHYPVYAVFYTTRDTD